MEYRRLGRSGLEVSAIGLGTNNFGNNEKPPFHIGPEGAAAVVNQALDLGINMIDTANVYGGGFSEEYVGRALKGRRHEAVIATKVAGPMGEGPNRVGASRQHIVSEVEDSLRRLGTDYIDLYQIHWPDPNTPIEETLRALDDLVRQGKVRYVGCSNFKAWQVCEANWTSRSAGVVSFVSVQPAYSMLNREVEVELVPFCLEYGVGILPFYPLASGFLTGKYRRGENPAGGTRLAANDRGLLTDANFDLLEGLEQFSAERGHTVLELAFAWLLSNPAVSSVIAGATKPEQVVANAGSAGWNLTSEDVTEIDALLGE